MDVVCMSKDVPVGVMRGTGSAGALFAGAGAATIILGCLTVRARLLVPDVVDEEGTIYFGPM